MVVDGSCSARGLDESCNPPVRWMQQATNLLMMAFGVRTATSCIIIEAFSHRCLATVYPWRSRAQLPISLRVWKRQQQNHWSIDVYWSVAWCWRCTGAWKQIHWPQILAKTWLNLVELRNHGMHSRHSLPGHGPSNSLPLRVGCLKDGFGSKVLPQETHIKTYKNHTAANEFRGWIWSRKGAWTSKGAHWKKPENEFC